MTKLNLNNVVVTGHDFERYTAICCSGGIANIKANGKKLGRPFNAKTKKLKLAKNQKRIQTLLAKGVSKSKIAKIFNVERATLHRYVLRLSAQA